MPSEPRVAPAGGWPAAAAGVAAAALYACSASPHVGSGDVAEFQALAATGGIAHAGYPLYVLALRAAARLPAGGIATRAALASALAGGLAVALAAGHATRVSGRAWIGLAVAATLALSGALWREAAHAEIYAFSLAIAAATFLAARAWFAAPSAPRAALAGFLAGCGLVSHLGILGLLTPLAVTVAWRAAHRRVPPAQWLGALLGLLAGVVPPLLYLATQDRSPAPMNYLADTFGALPAGAGAGERLGRIARLLSAHQFFAGTGVAFRPFAHTPERLESLLVDVTLNEVSPPGLLLALLGGGVLLRRGSRDGALLAGWVGAQLAWLAFAAYADTLQGFFLPALWALAILQAHGLAWLARTRRGLAAGTAALLVLLALGRAMLPRPPAPVAAHAGLVSAWNAGTGGVLAARADTTWEAYARPALARLAPRALVLACWEEGTPLRYAHFAESRRPDVEIRWRCHDPAGLRADAAAAFAAGRPVYTTFDPALQLPPGLVATRIGSWPAGALWRIVPR